MFEYVKSLLGCNDEKDYITVSDIAKLLEEKPVIGMAIRSNLNNLKKNQTIKYRNKR